MEQQDHGVPRTARWSIVGLRVISLGGLAGFPPVRADPQASQGQKAAVVESLEHFKGGQWWQKWTEEERQRFKMRGVDWRLMQARISMSELGDFEAVHVLEACLDGGLRTPSVYLNLAIAHLTFGRFDSAIAVLERGQREIRPSAQFKPVFQTFLEDARRVKAALTDARDQLRAKGQDVSYPDERIFPVALAAAAAEKDAFLVLNLADAWLSAFPTSPMALRCVADVNLSSFEHAADNTFIRAPRTDAAWYLGRQTNVPPARAEHVLSRGEDALNQLHDRDKTDPYPAMRMTHHVFWTVSRDLKGKTTARGEIPSLMAARNVDQNPSFAEEQKAFIQYVRSVFFLSLPTWKNATLGNDILKWLQDARRRDPATKVYADALAWWRVHGARVTREKLAAGLRDDAESARRTLEAFGLPESKTPVAQTPGGRLVHAGIRGMWKYMIDEIRKEDPLAAEAFALIGCPACWGSGKNAFSGKPCDTCGGDGRADR